MQGIVGAMLGMSLFLGSVILSGSQRQSEKQSESDILHFIFFLSHLDPILRGSFSLFLRYAWNEPFLGSVILSESQRDFMLSYFHLLHLALFWYIKPCTLAVINFKDTAKISIFAVERVVLCGILYPTLYSEIDLLS